MYEAERGLVELRQGRLLYVTLEGGSVAHGRVVAAVEGLSHQTLDALRGLNPAGTVRLALTHHRAHALGLAETPRSVSVGLSGACDPAGILRLATSTKADGAGVVDVREASEAEEGGLTLARLGRLIPAVVTVAVDPEAMPMLDDLRARGAVLAATTEQIRGLAATGRVELVHVSSGPVPLDEAEDARFMVFRESNGLVEHVAVLVGDRASWPDPLPVRLHSACLTGDLFGSLRCDCGEQLRGSLRVFAESGGGVLLYLAQEGRGIGLGNKLRAYVLQEEGLDTIDADGTLGFGPDERRYQAAVEILRYLQITRVQLLTNNPEKVQAVRDGGIDVVERRPLFGRLNPHNLQYVSTKVERAGHWLSEMLSGALPVK